jgi:TatA/E family protein of Tat protein translocase
MPSFADSIFLFVLALLLFGPKRLPVLARELGKWVGEFRRASNEFKFQMEEELRLSEQADRQKQIAAMEAAAPIPPPLHEPAEPEHPHLARSNAVPDPYLPAPSPAAAPGGDVPAASLSPAVTLPDPETAAALAQSVTLEEAAAGVPPRLTPPGASSSPAASSSLTASSSPAASSPLTAGSAEDTPTTHTDNTRPIPIATSGDLHMMPPPTGLPLPRIRSSQPVPDTGALGGLLESIPAADPTPAAPAFAQAAPETAAHGD